MIEDFDLIIGKQILVHKTIRISERSEQFKNVKTFETVRCGRIGYYIGYTFKYPGIIHRNGDGVAWFERTDKPLKVARIIFSERGKEQYAFFEDIEILNTGIWNL